MSFKFKAEDVVQLKIGGPKMLVTGILPTLDRVSYRISVLWSDKHNVLHTADLPGFVLIHYKETEW